MHPCASRERQLGPLPLHATEGSVGTGLLLFFVALKSSGVTATQARRAHGAARAEGLKYAEAAFITLGGDERNQFLAEVERLTTSWAALKSSRAETE